MVEKNISYRLANPDVNKLNEVEEADPEDKSTKGGGRREEVEARSILYFTDRRVRYVTASVYCCNLSLIVSDCFRIVSIIASKCIEIRYCTPQRSRNPLHKTKHVPKERLRFILTKNLTLCESFNSVKFI